MLATVGEKIRAARQLRGLTQDDLSGDIVTGSMISQVEMNKTRPSIPLLQMIAQRLGMPVEHFVDDLDEEFPPDLQLVKANYHLLVHETDAAKAALAPEVTAFNSRYTKYKEMLARMLLQDKQYAQCIRVLEELREYALYSQDKDTLLLVYQLTGYAEYDTNNLRAAIHEWERAITIGEQITIASSGSKLRIETQLADISFAIYRAYLQIGETRRAVDYLRKAGEYSQAWSDIRSLSDALYTDALLCDEHSEGKKPHNLLDKAVWALEVGIGIMARNRIQAELNVHTASDGADSFDRSFDPWFNSMRALAVAEPASAFETDIIWIRSLIEHGQVELAMDRIEHCTTLLTRFPLATSDEDRIRYRLQVLWSQSQYANGQQQEAVSTLSAAIEQIEGRLPTDEVLFGQSLLLRWLRESNDLETGRKVVGQVMQMLKNEEQKQRTVYME